MPGEKPKRILVAYSMMSTFTPTTLEYLLAIKKFTDYEVHYIHVTHDARMNVDFNDYDVLFHNYCARLCFEGYVSAHYERAVQRFRGLKIVAVQDDYDRTATFHRAVRRMGFHVLLTCIQREFWPLVYPASELPGVTMIQGLTGYMPERLVQQDKHIVPLSERKTWLAYRGRDIGPKYGRLGFEKFEIGRRMIEECESRGVPHNIAMDNASRIYGDAWFEFLGSSRAMLGAESGSNAFDFDCNLERRIEEFTRREGRAPTYHEFRPILDPIEAPFNVGQISPRVFETAVMRTPMINFRGSYSGAIEPGIHYIALEKDFSNLDAVFAQLQDLDLLQGFVDRAYEKLVASDEYGYRSLARLITDAIEEEYPRRIDLTWIRYRQETGEPWMRPIVVKEPDTEEEARQLALIEAPTDLPLNLEDFNERQARLSQLMQEAIYRRAKQVMKGETPPHGEVGLVHSKSDGERFPPLTETMSEETARAIVGGADSTPDLVDRLAARLHNTPLWNTTQAIWRLLPLNLRNFVLRKLGRPL